MHGTTLRRGGAAVAAALLVAGSFGAAPPASARPTAACTGQSGVTVVVDFGTLGGGVQIRCVTQAVTSGFDALRKAGFTYDATARFGGLLCRIDGRPADDPCINAPPPDRYWAYWTATAPGGSWTYSDQGAGNRVPPPGSVEGWAFADGCDRAPGGAACPSATTTTTAPRSSTTSVTAGPAGGSATAPSTATGSGGPSVGRGTTTTTARGESTRGAVAGDRAPAAGQPGDEELVIDGEVASAVGGSGSDDEGGGSAVGVVVAGLIALALAGAAVVAARRRRSDEAGS